MKIDVHQIADALAANRPLACEDGREYHMLMIGPDHLRAVIAALRAGPRMVEVDSAVKVRLLLTAAQLGWIRDQATRHAKEAFDYEIELSDADVIRWFSRQPEELQARIRDQADGKFGAEPPLIIATDQEFARAFERLRLG